MQETCYSGSEDVMKGSSEFQEPRNRRSRFKNEGLNRTVSTGPMLDRFVNFKAFKSWNKIETVEKALEMELKIFKLTYSGPFRLYIK